MNCLTLFQPHSTQSFSLQCSITAVDVTVAQKLHQGFAVKRAVFRLTVAFFGSFFPQKKNNKVFK